MMLCHFSPSEKPPRAWRDLALHQQPLLAGQGRGGKASLHPVRPFLFNLFQAYPLVSPALFANVTLFLVESRYIIRV